MEEVACMAKGEGGADNEEGSREEAGEENHREEGGEDVARCGKKEPWALATWREAITHHGQTAYTESPPTSPGAPSAGPCRSTATDAAALISPPQIARALLVGWQAAVACRGASSAVRVASRLHGDGAASDREGGGHGSEEEVWEARTAHRIAAL